MNKDTFSLYLEAEKNVQNAETALEKTKITLQQALFDAARSTSHLYFHILCMVPVLGLGKDVKYVLISHKPGAKFCLRRSFDNNKLTAYCIDNHGNMVMEEANSPTKELSGKKYAEDLYRFVYEKDESERGSWVRI